MNNNKCFEPLEVLAPLSILLPDEINDPAPVSVECDTGYTCKVGKATY